MIVGFETNELSRIVRKLDGIGGDLDIDETMLNSLIMRACILAGRYADRMMMKDGAQAHLADITYEKDEGIFIVSFNIWSRPAFEVWMKRDLSGRVREISAA